MGSVMKIRPARITDTSVIHALIKEHAAGGILLPRPLADICEKIQRFVVCEDRGSVAGCGALHVADENLAEIRSLVVAQHCQRKGVGAGMVAALEKQARSLGVKNVFALSFKPVFFKKVGYRETKKEFFPHKIWHDCVKCPLFPDCGETALIKELHTPVR